MRRGIQFFSMALLIFSNVCLLHSQKMPPSQIVEDFDIEGIALFQCQCTAYACPCQKNGAPTHGTCEAADFAHITTGHSVKIRLDGLNVAVVGNLVDRNAPRLYATLYIDEKANPSQRAALTAILQFLNGSYEASSLNAARVKMVPMEFRESPDKTLYTLNIPGILEERAFLHRDASGNPVSTVTAMDSWSNTEHYVDNALFKYHDQEVHRAWDHSGGYANIKYFRLTKKMYDDKEMLGQFGDFSGHWTPEQLALIHKQGLKEI
jgi:hypothetical protein